MKKSGNVNEVQVKLSTQAEYQAYISMSFNNIDCFNIIIGERTQPHTQCLA